MKKLEVLAGLGDKINRIDELFARIDELDQKFNTQVERIDVIQSNVNLTMKSIGEVRQEQVAAAKDQMSKHSPSESSPSANDSIMGTPPIVNSLNKTHPLNPPAPTEQQRQQSNLEKQKVAFVASCEEQHPRRPWMPKMDFPVLMVVMYAYGSTDVKLIFPCTRFLNSLELLLLHCTCVAMRPIGFMRIN